jgi:hypothetical protein
VSSSPSPSSQRKYPDNEEYKFALAVGPLASATDVSKPAMARLSTLTNGNACRGRASVLSRWSICWKDAGRTVRCFATK